MKTVLITGGSRGLGLEFARQYLMKGHQVITVSRTLTGSDELQKLKTKNNNLLTSYQFDISNETSRVQLYQNISEKFKSIDILINNAGIISGNEKTVRKFGNLIQEELERIFLVNTISPLMMTEKFFPLIKKGKKPVVVNITSDNGSISKRNYKGKYGYCSSKAALNMITKALSYELKEYGIIVISLHPGWVKTSMTADENAPLEASNSINNMIEVIESLEINDTGKFLDLYRNIIPW